MIVTPWVPCPFGPHAFDLAARADQDQGQAENDGAGSGMEQADAQGHQPDTERRDDIGSV
jgi:hypothetical protein